MVLVLLIHASALPSSAGSQLKDQHPAVDVPQAWRSVLSIETGFSRTRPAGRRLQQRDGLAPSPA